MFKLRSVKQIQIAFYIAETVFAAVCIWSYAAFYYGIFLFNYKEPTKLAFTFSLIMFLGGVLAIYIVFTSASRARKNYLDLAKRIQTVSEEERIAFSREWLSEGEQRYFKQSHPRIEMRVFLLWMLVLSGIGILHIGYICVSEGCTLWRGISLLFRLSGCIFAFSLWHYVLARWKFSITILKKWEYYRRKGKSL